MADERPRPAPVSGPRQDRQIDRQIERQVAFRTGLSAESRAAALLIFVEVKARDTLDDAAWAVSDRQRQRIIAAAEAWLARHGDERIEDIRFDAVLVAPRRIPRHIPAAFDASK